MNTGAIGMFLAGLAAVTSVAGCAPNRPNDLDKLAKVRMTLGESEFELWVADTFDTQLRGLMFITAEQMAPLPDGTERGMLFVFDRPERGSFWMKNTIIPLDIAYVDASGIIVSTYTMTPLDARSNRYPPARAYRYAIEVNADRLGELGLEPGDAVEIPASALKGAR